jgi:predicted Abi (CAAX) family protease
MPFIYAVAIGMLVGIAVAAAASRLSLPRVLQSVLAVMFAGALATGVTLSVLSVVFPDGLFGFWTLQLDAMQVLVLAALALLLHWSLARLGRRLPWAKRHQVMVAGCVAGICGAVSVARIFNFRILL